jgi:hypothetical protein
VIPTRAAVRAPKKWFARLTTLVAFRPQISKVAVLARSPGCAPKRRTRYDQHRAADDEQCKVEAGEGQSALLAGSTTDLLLHVAAFSTVALTC